MKHFFAHILPAYVSAIAAGVVAWVAVFTVGPILDKYALQKEAESLREEVSELNAQLSSVEALVGHREGEAARLGVEKQRLEKAIAGAEDENAKLSANLKELQASNELAKEENTQLAKTREALLSEADRLQYLYASHLSGVITLQFRASLVAHLRPYLQAKASDSSMSWVVYSGQNDVGICGRSIVEEVLSSREIDSISVRVKEELRRIVNAFVASHSGLYEKALSVPRSRREEIRSHFPEEAWERIPQGDYGSGKLGKYEEAWRVVRREMTAEICEIVSVAEEIESSLPDLEAAIIGERKSLTAASREAAE